MANYCNLRTKTHFEKKEVLNNLINHLKSKYNIDAKYTIEPTSNESDPEYFVNFKIKGLVLPFWISPKNIEFYDVPSTAFERHNRENKQNEYIKQYYNNFDFQYPKFFLYALFYNYIKYFLAVDLNAELDSDGAGIITPFAENKERFDNAKNWFKYWEKHLSSSKINKYLKREKVFFPEMFYE